MLPVCCVLLILLVYTPVEVGIVSQKRQCWDDLTLMFLP